MSESNNPRDKMTGLYSRSHLLQNLDGILGHNGQIVLMLLDIDRCLTFNDRFGHLQGDKEIIKVGREIQALTGKSSLVCRWGGDKFGVILYESSLENARAIAEQIRQQRVPVEVVMEQRLLRTFTLSIGIAHFPDQSFNAASLIEAAELALDKAKSGRNRVLAIGDF